MVLVHADEAIDRHEPFLAGRQDEDAGGGAGRADRVGPALVAVLERREIARGGGRLACLENRPLHRHVEPALADVAPDGDSGINRSARR